VAKREHTNLGLIPVFALVFLIATSEDALAKENLVLSGVDYYKIYWLPAGNYSYTSGRDFGYSTSKLYNCKTIIKGETADKLDLDLSKQGYDVNRVNPKTLCIGADSITVSLNDNITAYYDGEWLVARKNLIVLGNNSSYNETKTLMDEADTVMDAQATTLAGRIAPKENLTTVLEVVHIRRTEPKWLSIYETQTFEKSALLYTRFPQEIGALLNIRYLGNLKVAESRTIPNGGNVTYRYYIRDETKPEANQFGEILTINDAETIYDDPQFLNTFLLLNYYADGLSKLSAAHILRGDILANIEADSELYSNLTADTRFGLDYSQRIKRIYDYSDVILPENEKEVTQLDTRFKDIDEFYTAQTKMLDDLGPDSVPSLLYADEISQERELLSAGVIDLGNRLKENKDIIDKAYNLCYARLGISLNEQAHADMRTSITLAILVPVIILLVSIFHEEIKTEGSIVWHLLRKKRKNKDPTQRRL
jgi:hypothetical protein